VRWDDLFRDLEAQLAAAEGEELDAEVADRTRRESARLGLVDRARGAVGSRITAQVRGAGPVRGVLLEVGSQWLLVGEDGGREAVLPLPAVLSVAGLTAWSGVPGAAGQVFDRLGLGSALRGIARDRAPVSVQLLDGSTVSGTIDRVGADFLELSTRDVAEPVRTGRPVVRTVPFAAVAVVRSGP
jgi:hypothetical protein